MIIAIVINKIDPVVRRCNMYDRPAILHAVILLSAAFIMHYGDTYDFLVRVAYDVIGKDKIRQFVCQLCDIRFFRQQFIVQISKGRIDFSIFCLLHHIIMNGIFINCVFLWMCFPVFHNVPEKFCLHGIAQVVLILKIRIHRRVEIGKILLPQ